MLVDGHNQERYCMVKKSEDMRFKIGGIYGGRIEFILKSEISRGKCLYHISGPICIRSGRKKLPQ